MSTTNSLATPWVVVIVLSVVVAMQMVYIYFIRFRGRGVVRGTGRPRTELYQLTRPRDDVIRGAAYQRTGYSPAMPAPIGGSKW